MPLKTYKDEKMVKFMRLNIKHKYFFIYKYKIHFMNLNTLGSKTNIYLDSG